MTSPEPLRSSAEDEILEGQVGGGALVTDLATAAEGLQAGEEGRELAFVGADQGFVDGDLVGAAGLGVGQAEVAEKAGREFRGVEEVEELDLEALVEEKVEGFLVAVGVEEIAEDEDKAAAFRALAEGVEAAVEIGFPGGFGQVIEEADDLVKVGSCPGPCRGPCPSFRRRTGR